MLMLKFNGKIFHAFFAKFIFWQHIPNRSFQHIGLQKFMHWRLFQVPWIQRMMVINFLNKFIACNFYHVNISDFNFIPDIFIRNKLALMFAEKILADLRCKPSESLICGVKTNYCLYK